MAGENLSEGTESSGEQERNGSVWSALSEGSGSSGIMKTTTVEIRRDAMPGDWEDILESTTDEDSTEAWSFVIEQGRLARAIRRAE